MCRQDQLRGCAAVAFGAGVLVGTWLGGGFLCHCLGIGLIVFGCTMLFRK